MNYIFKQIDTCSFCHSKEFKILGKRLNGAQGFYPERKIGITTTIVKCKHCDLIYSNPMPIPVNINDHYGVPPESYWNYDTFHVEENYMQGLITQMNSIQPIKLGSKVLDIGAGVGKSMVAFERAGYDVYGIEPSESFYDRAINHMKVSKEKLQMSMVENCEFEENSFDVILLTAVLEHVYEPAIVIEKIMQWLKPGGLVFIEVPSSNWLINKWINIMYKFRFRNYVGNLSPMHEPYHLYEFSEKSFEQHAIKHNYEIVRTDYYLCQTFLPKLLDPLVKWYMKKMNSGMELAIWLRKK